MMVKRLKKHERYKTVIYCLLLHYFLIHDCNFADEVLLACNKLGWGWVDSTVRMRKI